MYLLDDGCGLAEEFLHIVRAHAGRCGLDVLSCPDPLIPSRTQAVLVPSRGVGFLAGTADDVPEGLTQRHIRLDVLPDPVRQRALRRTMRSDTRQQQLALASAVEQLRMANLLHMSAKRPGGTVRSRWGVRLQFSQQQGEKHGLQHRFSRHISAHQLPVPKPLFG